MKDKHSGRSADRIAAPHRLYQCGLAFALLAGSTFSPVHFARAADTTPALTIVDSPAPADTTAAAAIPAPPAANPAPVATTAAANPPTPLPTGTPQAITNSPAYAAPATPATDLVSTPANTPVTGAAGGSPSSAASSGTGVAGIGSANIGSASTASSTPVGGIAAAPAPVAPSQNVTTIPPNQSAAMPPALMPEQTTPPGNVSEIGKSVSDQAAKNAALPAIGGSAGLPAGPNAVAGTTTDSAALHGAANGIANAPVHPNAHMAGPAGPDTYYDSSSPSSPGSVPPPGFGPRKVNPAKEPGQKFIVVEKEEAAGGRDAQLAAADRAIQAGQYEAAIGLYDALYDRYPKDSRVLMGRAVAYQRSGQPETAAKMYDGLLDLDPQDIDAQVNMLGLMSKEYPDVALRRLMELHQKHPGNSTIVAQIGVTEGQEGQFDDAIRYLQIASNLQPNNAQHLFNLAIVADKAGKKEDALAYYQQALDVDLAYGNGRSIPRDKVFERMASLRQQ